jgi:branched-chain amino acid aminotransferase
MNVTPVSKSKISDVDFDSLEFGKTFTDYMLVMDYDGVSWSEPSIEPLKPLEMHPATSVLHYGQAIFEGLKAYKNEKGEANIFRLRDNLSRLNKSAVRMMMPQIDAEAMVGHLSKFVSMQKEWIPREDQGSMYIRPFMISSDSTLRAIASKGYKFMAIACPVGFYYNKSLSILLEKNYRRAAKGGVGYAKAAGNYAASFYPSEEAKNLGYDQVLWTDITNEFALEELGSANFFYVMNDVLYTPAMHDSILKGITRDTVLQLAESVGLTACEEFITAERFENDLKSGNVKCMFATGTAASITYIQKVTIDVNMYEVNSADFPKVKAISESLDAHKFLKNTGKPEWNVVV